MGSADYPAIDAPLSLSSTKIGYHPFHIVVCPNIGAIEDAPSHLRKFMSLQCCFLSPISMHFFFST